MAEEEDQGTVYIDHPNRRKATSKITKFIVIILLLVSAALMVIISVGGWDTIEGAKPLQIAYILLYVLLAFFVFRWSRGVLPLIAALLGTALVALVLVLLVVLVVLHLDVPGLLEAAHGEGDEEDLHGDEDQRQHPEDPLVEGRVGQPLLVAVEPRGA